jgi:ABC-type lipoprotein export system ATPase subunit
VTAPIEPLIELTGVVKQALGPRPLRVAQLAVTTRDRLALSGFDAEAAELFLHLVTGAAVPDEGDVVVAGHNTRSIATDTEWLASLDRFGIVTERAILLETLPIVANLALPLTLALDPLPGDVRREVEKIAALVGLAAGRLAEPASTLTAEERVRVHLARAVAPGPQLLLLEHPTARLQDAALSSNLGATLKRVAETRALGFIALTEDAAFASASGAIRLRLKPVTGQLQGEGLWQRFLGRR